MELATILALVGGAACCGLTVFIIVVCVVFFLLRRRQQGVSAGAAADGAEPVESIAEPEPVAPPEPTVAPEPAMPPAAPPGSLSPLAEGLLPIDEADHDPTVLTRGIDYALEPAAAPTVPQPQPRLPGMLPPIDESDHDPTVLDRGIDYEPDSTPIPPRTPSTDAWSAPTEEDVPRPTMPTPPDPSGIDDVLRPGATIIPDDDLLDEIDGDQTVLMPRVPSTLDEDDD